MSDTSNAMDANARRKRRRRRRKKGPDGAEAAAPPPRTASVRKGRRTAEPEVHAPSLPTTGRNPWAKRSSRTRRAAPEVAGARRRKLSPAVREEAAGWLGRLPVEVLSGLNKALGGQPPRGGGEDKLVQLVLRALAQPSRLGAVAKSLGARARQALAALVQAGGVAHIEEFHRELALSLGGSEREWTRELMELAEKGLIAGSEVKGNDAFYVIPELLMDALIADLQAEMEITPFIQEDIRVTEEVPFSPPLTFTLTTLATYIEQYKPGLTQSMDITRHAQDAMDLFFAQVWPKNSDLFHFHLDFMLKHGMIEMKKEGLGIRRDVLEEWLQLEPEDQRDLVFSALGDSFPLAEWVMWVIHRAGGWVAERPLMALYRRWRKGEEWRKRLLSGNFAPPKGAERDSYTFTPLVRSGILDMGQWGQEKFYRVSTRGQHLLNPPADDGFMQFYLTPSFEIMAPAGLAPILLARIGELADLVGCDRANTYKITELSIERAMRSGWRRDDVLQFLRDNSQIGLPDNVEMTLKGWMGHRGNVEFHELMLMTVHRSQIKRLEDNRRIKPYILHRFAPGMYAIDPARKAEIEAVLEESHLEPASEVRHYPGNPGQADARVGLQRMLMESREMAMGPSVRPSEQIPPELLRPVPGTKGAKKPVKRTVKPAARMTVEEVITAIERAMALRQDVEIVYQGTRAEVVCQIQPQRRAIKDGAQVLLAVDRADGAKKSFALEKVMAVRQTEES